MDRLKACEVVSRRDRDKLDAIRRFLPFFPALQGIFHGNIPRYIPKLSTIDPHACISWRFVRVCFFGGGNLSNDFQSVPSFSKSRARTAR